MRGTKQPKRERVKLICVRNKGGFGDEWGA